MAQSYGGGSGSDQAEPKKCTRHFHILPGRCYQLIPSIMGLKVNNLPCLKIILIIVNEQ